MLNLNKYNFDDAGSKGERNEVSKSAPPRVKDSRNTLLKKEVLEVFRKFGYLGEEKDYEVTFKTTSGSIAWININSIEIMGLRVIVWVLSVPLFEKEGLGEIF